MARYSVQKCICHDRSFEWLKHYAQAHRITRVEELQKRKICSCGCRMCMPYVQLMLDTGKTAFEPGEPNRQKKDR